MESSGYDETALIVFCLRELKACSAKEKVLELRKALEDGTRFADTPHDATLQVQIEGYLKAVAPPSPAPEQPEALDAIVAKLRHVTLREHVAAAFSPEVILGHSAATKEVVSKGEAIVPYLLRRMDSSAFDETVLIVFCLREIKTCAAKEKVLELRKALEGGKRFPGVSHHHLLVEIRRYLKRFE